MYIEKVVIENIKFISKFEMNFAEPAGWHVLIGDNGTGKTSVLKAIAVCLLGDQFGFNYTKDNWLKKKTLNGFCSIYTQLYQYEINLLFNPSDEYIQTSFSQTPKQNALQNPIEYRSFWYEHSRYLALGIGTIRIFDPSKDFINDDWSRKPGQYLSLLQRVFSFSHAIDWILHIGNRSRDKVSPTLSQEEIKTYENAVLAIQKMVNEWNLIEEVTLSRISSDGIFFWDKNNVEIEVSELSEGYQSVLIIFFEIIRQMVRLNDYDVVFEPILNSENQFIDLLGIVLIDEIDSHLHPSWQSRVGQWFTKFFPKVQFIVTTHSPLVCRACEKGSIWKLAGEESGEITGVYKDRLIYGNIFVAYGTEEFGDITNEESLKKQNRLSELYEKSMLGIIINEEEIEYQHLKSIFPTFNYSKK